MNKQQLSTYIDGLLKSSYINGKRIDKLEDKSQYTLAELKKLANKIKMDKDKTENTIPRVKNPGIDAEFKLKLGGNKNHGK